MTPQNREKAALALLVTFAGSLLLWATVLIARVMQESGGL